jgi:hypothetical protein
MRTFLIALIIVGSGICQISSHLEARYVGRVTEIKLFNINDIDHIYLWVQADKEYMVRGVKHIPSIYIGDTLFEYWSNYQKIGVGTRRDLVIYEIK